MASEHSFERPEFERPEHEKVFNAARHAARKVAGSHSDIVEDVVQHTFLKFLTVSSIVLDPGGWAYTVARRQAAKAMRRRNTQAQTKDEIDGAKSSKATKGNGDSGVWQYEEPQTTEPDPHNRTVTKEVFENLGDLFSIIHTAVPGLPHHERAVVELTIEGLTLLEIADHTGRTYDQVRKDWSKAMLHLHHIVDEAVKKVRPLRELFGDLLSDPKSRHRVIGAALRMPPESLESLTIVADELIELIATG